MSVVPWQLDAIRPEAVKVCNRLAARAIAVPVAVGEARCFLVPDLTAVLPGGKHCAMADGATVRITVDGELWELMVNGRAASMAYSFPEGIRPDDVPEELRLAVFALALEPLLEALAAVAGCDVALVENSVADNEREDRFAIPFSVRGEDGAAWGCGVLSAPSSRRSLSFLLKMGNRFPRARSETSGDLPMRLSLNAAAGCFSVGELRAAAPGDILVFASPGMLEGRVFLESHGGAWEATLSDGVVKVVGPLFSPENRGVPMATEDIFAPAGHTSKNAANETSSPGPGTVQDAGFRLDDLEVRLSLELEERLAPLRELASIGPGYTFVTGADVASPVTLKVNGKAVGSGRLVDVGGQLGVMLTTYGLDGGEGSE